MRLIAVSQRVDVIAARGERRDALDQRWTRFLESCGLAPLLMPNDEDAAAGLFRAVPCAGVLLTGGNDLGADAPERDRTENRLIDEALARSLPVLGVCRGMQLIQQRYGARLTRVEGHAAKERSITRGGSTLTRTCYHNWGAVETVPDLEILARAEDQVIEEVRHRRLPIRGVMWHPERSDLPSPEDVALFHAVFQKV